jgi:acetylcholinesterase
MCPWILVTHGSEIPYVFGAVTNGTAQVQLSRDIIDYWVSFVTSLDPNDGHGNTLRELF